MKKVTLYTDGSCSCNPGPGGWGAILMMTLPDGTLYKKEYSGGSMSTTNNIMEMTAVLEGLKQLKAPCEVTLVCDSQYVINAFNQHWIDSWIRKNWKRGKNEPVKNVDLWKRLLKAAAPHKITWIWVKGHNGHPQNERCDLLATTAADGNDLIEDTILE